MKDLIEKIDLTDFDNLILKNPAELDDQELLSLDYLLHRAWQFLAAEHKVFFHGKEWSAEDLKALHERVKAEMVRRGFNHLIEDGLGDQGRPPLADDAEKQERHPGTAIQSLILDKKVFATEAAARTWIKDHGFRFDKVDETESFFRYRQGQPEDFDPNGFGGGEPFKTIRLTDGVLAVIGFPKGKAAGVIELPEDIDKGVRQAFGSYGGKRALAHKIASFIPHHRVYMEPFAGGAAVFYAKDPSPKEILNDRDAEIAFMHRFIRDHSQEDRAALARREWTIKRDTHERLKKMEPDSDRDRFYKAFYLTRSSYGKMRGGSFNPANEGVQIDFPANVERAQARLRNVDVSNKDYLDVLKEHDDPETFFYIDPPYPGEFNLFDFGFKEEQFIRALKSLKAKWIVSYTAKRAEVFKGFNVYRVKRRNQMKGPGGNQEWVTELLVSNFPLKPLHLYIEKGISSEPAGMEADAPPLFPHVEDDAEIEKVRAAFKSPGGKYRLYKKIIRLIPEHKSYVETFAGGAQVLFHKKRSDLEAINDVNKDLIDAYRFLKAMTTEDWEWLKKQSWIISRAHAKRLFEMIPKTARERFYRFAYLNKASYWGRTDIWEGMRPNGSTGLGARIRLADRLPEIQERLKGVRLHSWDWKDVVKEYDGPGAFFYLDPPYPLHWPKEKGKFGNKFFREEDMLPVLKSIKGRFLLSYELEKAGMFKGFKTYRIKTLHTGSHQLGGARKEYELLVANYALKSTDLFIEKSSRQRLQSPES